MAKDEYQLLNTVSSLDEAKTVIKVYEVSKYRTSSLADYTKYSYRCEQYRKYPMC